MFKRKKLPGASGNSQPLAVRKGNGEGFNTIGSTWTTQPGGKRVVHSQPNGPPAKKLRKTTDEPDGDGFTVVTNKRRTKERPTVPATKANRNVAPPMKDKPPKVEQLRVSFAAAVSFNEMASTFQKLGMACGARAINNGRTEWVWYPETFAHRNTLVEWMDVSMRPPGLFGGVEFKWATQKPPRVPSSRPFQVIVRGYPTECDTEELLSAATAQGYTVTTAVRFMKRLGNDSTVPMPLVSLHFASQEAAKGLLQQGHVVVCHTRFRVEPQKTAPPPLQCFNCFGFGHMRHRCPLAALCRVCGKAAHLQNGEPCPNRRCCANCGEEHMATYHKCEKYRAETSMLKAAAPSSGLKDGRTFAQAVRKIQSVTEAQTQQKLQMVVEKQLREQDDNVRQLLAAEMTAKVVPFLCEAVFDHLLPLVAATAGVSVTDQMVTSLRDSVVNLIKVHFKLAPIPVQPTDIISNA